jgi:plastocyanin
MTTSIYRLLFIAVLAIIAGCSNNSTSYNSSGGSGTLFESGTVAPGGSFVHVFASAGSIRYFCRFHGSAGGGGMSGTITAASGGTPSMDTVFMDAMTFSPAAKAIDVGDTVKWINSSSLNHTVTSDN